MKLELRFFASLREALGVSQESITIPESIKTIADLRTFLGKVLRCALNQVMVDASTPLKENAEIAFFPPVTGG